jgi:hypothetical protein
VQGEHALQGNPIICLAMQFWHAEIDALPEVFFFNKRMFNEYLCLNKTVESVEGQETTFPLMLPQTVAASPG